MSLNATCHLCGNQRFDWTLKQSTVAELDGAVMRGLHHQTGGCRVDCHQGASQAIGEPPMTAKLSAEELERLEALAKAATPGPWECTDDKVWVGTMTPISVPVCCNRPLASGECCGNAVEGQDWEPNQDLIADSNEPDAAYIAAVNPSVLLRLTAQVRDAEAVNATDIELARLRRIASWQPIETWDGAEGECDSVLVSVEGCVGEAVYRGREDGWWWINNYPTDAHGERIFPTHWQPLPPPPARLEKERTA